MKIVLATGIYPPDIGGPATYVQNLAWEFVKKNIEVIVVTYGRNVEQRMKNEECAWHVVRVSKSIPILRWFLYALALRKHAKDADVVYAFSSVSTGVPMVLAHVKKPKKVLRLGGDFFWERYTAGGGMMSLNEWYESLHWTLWISHRFIHWLLNRFDLIVFSTRFQEEIYEEFYQSLPQHGVIENAIPTGLPRSFGFAQDRLRFSRKPGLFRLLFMGRFVGFKNLFTLLDAILQMPHMMLTLVGEGPLKKNVLSKVIRDGTSDRVRVLGSVYGAEKDKLLKEHDVLIIPSTTEISPNTALEAQAAGLPVLLTEETGLSMDLKKGMIVRKLRTKEDIQKALFEVEQGYEEFAEDAIKNISTRTWREVCEEHLALFKNLL
ncbi:glycosyltransferase family 4 protein [Candidatus Peregrinibacteria bacterium]|nr:glycosyltransferase family 4 protein [Candidatus Peregrinibacteria bacterium]